MSINIVVALPRDCQIPMEVLQSFTTNENLHMIMIGIKAVQFSQQNIVTADGSSNNLFQIELSKKENEIILRKRVYDELITDERNKQSSILVEQLDIANKKISMEYRDTISKYEKGKDTDQENIQLLKNKITEFEIEFAKKNERDMLRDLNSENDANIKSKNKIDEKNKELDDYKERLHVYKHQENEKIEKLSIELSLTKDNLNNIIINHEKEKNLLLNESLEKSLFDNSKIIINKSNSRGKEGETFLRDILIKTFSTFENFDIIDKSRIPHSGDLWLQIHEHRIICDSKNYIDNFVGKTDRDKLIFDAKFNKGISIAWLVSTVKPILCFTQAPFMIDIKDNIIYCYINSLMECMEPEKILKSAYFACKLIYDNWVNVPSNENAMTQYKLNETRIFTIVQKLLDNTRACTSNLDNLKKFFEDNNNGLRDILNDEIKNIEQKNVTIVKEWWDRNTTKNESGKSKIFTNDIYKRFNSIEENQNIRLDSDMFKQIIRSIVNDDNEIVFSKTGKGQFTIKNYEFLDKINEKK